MKKAMVSLAILVAGVANADTIGEPLDKLSLQELGATYCQLLIVLQPQSTAPIDQWKKSFEVYRRVLQTVYELTGQKPTSLGMVCVGETFVGWKNNIHLARDVL